MNYELRIVHQIGGYEMDKFFNIGVDIKNERIKADAFGQRKKD